MVNGSIEKAKILIEAFPYIRTFFGKTFVIKYGGSAMKDPELKKAVMLDVILLKYVGLNPVIVHGGGPEIGRTDGAPWQGAAVFVGGHRVTDAETMEIVQMVLVGKVNQEIVSLINKYGGKVDRPLRQRRQLDRSPRSATRRAVSAANGSERSRPGFRRRRGDHQPRADPPPCRARGTYPSSRRWASASTVRVTTSTPTRWPGTWRPLSRPTS